MLSPCGQAARRTSEYRLFRGEKERDKRWLLFGLVFVRTLHIDQVREYCASPGKATATAV